MYCNRKSYLLVSAFIASALLVSCQRQQPEHFGMALVVTQDLGFVLDEPLDNGIKSLLNYRVEATCAERFFVPDVSIIRADFSPEWKETLTIPLSFANSLKQWVKLPLTAPGLKMDYDDQIPQLKTPPILAAKSNIVADMNAVRANHPTAKFISVSKGKIASDLKEMRAEIGKALCENRKDLIEIVLQAPTPPPPSPTISLGASPATIKTGQSTSLKWNSSNATSVIIDNGIGTVEISGSTTLRPSASTTYIAKATGPGGSATAEARINVTSPPRPPPSGNRKVGPSASTTSTGTARGSGGSAIAKTRVTVRPAPPSPSKLCYRLQVFSINKERSEDNPIQSGQEFSSDDPVFGQLTTGSLSAKATPCAPLPPDAEVRLRWMRNGILYANENLSQEEKTGMAARPYRNLPLTGHYQIEVLVAGEVVTAEPFQFTIFRSGATETGDHQGATPADSPATPPSKEPER